MHPAIARLQAQEAEREIDYRYIQFNLSVEEGQRGYVEYIKERLQGPRAIDPQYFGSALADHQRKGVFDQKHYWFAEAIMRKVLELGEPGPWEPGDRLGRQPVTLFI